ncbi:hypothetical protein Ava_D0005 [Trichormus variabilis ATCC 29413]|uniref:Uncharacterized protein n=2 Tax=Anabaena variabilis TaxID=264691 RepID=Q3M2W6_TRIV2|nr:hypothetical protein [Trichormus variabilis]ABA24670.1 hypothetical protein Ava_D0005 [Trichormus variabilis ATCC 29413]MBC1217705.1 hypothetical protein [Trichormus variabilis ARAD]MBC1259004.1 hypothetical protein [Trichormus variabilis V5]MBC1302715.1 hypothetical protein [Trichormus variabilis N2B]MBC1324570.1 hypothetical protein [Trichormus variabilis 9RC]
MVNTQPIFIKNPIIWTVTLTNEVVNRSPGAAVPKLLGTAGTNGTLIEAIQAYPLGDIVASPLRIFLKAPSSSDYVLLAETSLTSVSGSGNTTAIANYPIEVTLPRILFPASQTPATPNRGLRLPTGYALYAALGTATAGVIVTATGGDY